MKGRDKPRREPKKLPKSKRFDKTAGSRAETLERSGREDQRAEIPPINGAAQFDDEDDGA